MATVYLAHDLKHDRKVALKVLRPELSAILGAERFLAEIKTTANLQHPHILPLHDSGEAGGMVFYVMPFIEGHSLRDRLTQEKQLPVEDAVRIGREVAEALDYAHRRGVIHRDIKPENILLHDGRALVADFGIALAVSRSDGSSRMTETGMSLGTPFYMSPEQAMGERDITARSDVYSLGCVVYEMLTGEPPFTGPSAQAVMARVMTEQPRSLTLQRHTVPPHVEAAVATALEKLPADRFTTAQQFADALAKPGFTGTHRPGAVPAVARRPRARGLAAAAPWVLLALAVAWAAWGWWRPARPGGTGQVIVSSITLPDSAPLAFIGTAPYATGRTGLVLSPDGTSLVYVAQRGTGTQLYLRPMDRDSAFPLPGTEGACCPFFSPDGVWLAFLARDRLVKLRLGLAGSPIPIVPVNSFWGADWGDDGWIVVGDLQGRRVFRVNAETGAREELPSVTGVPRVLPRGRAILFGDTRKGTGSLYIPSRGVGRDLAIPGADLRYLPTGHVAYVSRGTLWAVPFELSGLRLTGEPLAVIPHLRTESSVGSGQYTFAPNGLLVYAPGGNGDVGRLVAYHRSGKVDTLPFEPALFGCLALSPDGRQIATRVADPGTGLWDLWVYDVAGGGPLRLTTTGDATCPSWSPDGRVTYVTRSDSGIAVLAQSPSGREIPSTMVILKPDVSASAVGWSPDGKRLVLFGRRDSTGTDVLVVPLDSAGVVHPVAETPALEWGGTFSPDGRWIAYSSSESGSDEIYVQPYPPTGQRWRISRNGGEEPLWTRGGKELVYRVGPEWWSVRVATAGQFTASEPGLLLRGPYLNEPGVEYAVSSDGDRLFLLAPATGSTTTTRLTVISNWFTMLRDLERRARRE
jgi:eukaryotic-like serine/threonine-protein kinase